MAFTLSEMISGALIKMGTLRISTLTSSGSSAAAVDASLVGQTSDDDYTYAPWFCLSTATSSGILSGEMAEVSSYSAGTGTFAFGTGALSTGTESGTVYGVGTPEFRLKFLVEKANEALRSLGDLDNVDTTTIGTSAGVGEYSLAVAMKRSSPVRIDLQTDTTSSASGNDWQTLHNYEYQPSAGGTAGKLIFFDDLPSGRDIRVWYLSQHGRLTTYSGVIDERVYPELAVLALTEKLYEFRNSLNRGSLPFDVQRWNDAKVQLQEARARFPIWKAKRQPKLMIAGDAEADHLPWPYPYGP